jgi:hypothetical protein
MRLKNIVIKDAIWHPFFIWNDGSFQNGFAKGIEACLKGNVKGGGDAGGKAEKRSVKNRGKCAKCERTRNNANGNRRV